MISVVVPSLGGDLSKTLNSLNSGTVKPIICLPNKKHNVEYSPKYKNISVIYSNKYGQVYQRIYGFKESKGDKVLQLDDDVFVSPNCLRLLVESIDSSDKSISVAPCWYDADSNKPLHQEKRRSIITMIYYWILNGNDGYVPGQVSLSGNNFGVNPKYVNERYVNVDWQPGGCVMHCRDNLILENYYPYEGKAYYEDLIHSFFLRSYGVFLVTNSKAICMTQINPRLNLRNEILQDIRAKTYFVKLANLSIIRMFLFYIIYVFRSMFLALAKKVKNT